MPRPSRINETCVAYIEDRASIVGFSRRHGPKSSYGTSLLMQAGRQNLELMATMTAPQPPPSLPCAARAA